MQISDFLSNAQMSALRSAATAPDTHEKYATSLNPEAVEYFIDLGRYYRCRRDRNYWASIENAYAKGGRWVVRFHGGKMTVTDLDFMLERNTGACLSTMGEWLKAGDGIVLIAEERATSVDWRNWKSVCSTLSSPMDNNEYDPRLTRSEKTAIRINRKREKMFEDARAVELRKKTGKGRSMNFDEHRAAYCRAEREAREARIISNARAIMEVI